MNIKILSWLLVFFVSTGCADSSYEECVLNNIKDAQSNYAASAIDRLCHEKFNDKNTSNNSKQDSVPNDKEKIDYSKYLLEDADYNLNSSATKKEAYELDESYVLFAQWFGFFFLILFSFFIKSILILRVIRAVCGYVFFLQIVTLFPIVTWIESLNLVSGKMAALAVIKLVILVFSGYMFFSFRHRINRIASETGKPKQILRSIWML